jgi:hypothetical protein
MAPTQPRLSDLHKTKERLVLTGEVDGKPVDIPVWVVKLVDTDIQACHDVANAAKARMMMSRAKEGSDEWLSYYGQTLEMGEDVGPLVELLSHFHILERTAVIQDEVAGAEDSEWAKDEYLQGLLTAWRGAEGQPGLMLAWQARDDDPETLDPALAAQIPEAIQVFDEIERFEAEVSKRLEVEREKFIREHTDDPIDELRRKIVDRHLEDQANAAWFRTYERAKVYYCTRTEEDHHVRYFKSPAEVAQTSKATRDEIVSCYNRISVEGTAGKESPVPQSSSPPSGSSDEAAPSQTSGPTAASG